VYFAYCMMSRGQRSRSPALINDMHESDTTDERMIIPSLTLYGYTKTAEQRTIIQHTVIGTLAADGWAVTFGTARRGLGGLWPRPVPSSLYMYQM